MSNNFNLEDRFLISNVLPNIIDGAYWGFCSYEDYTWLLKELGVSEGSEVEGISFSVLRGRSAVLVESAVSRLVTLWGRVMPSEASSGDVEESDVLSAGGVLRFRSFLEHAEKSGYEGFIGLNEISDSEDVSVEGKLYPTFKVNLSNSITDLATLDIKYLNHENEWTYIDRNTVKEDLVKSFTISPTRSCMLLPVKVTKGIKG